MEPSPRSTGDLLGARACDAEQISDVTPGAVGVEFLCDLGLDLLDLADELGFEGPGRVVPLDGVADRSERIGQGIGGFVKGGHGMRVGAFSSLYKRSLDDPSWTAYCFTNGDFKRRLKSTAAHSYRTPSASGTQPNTERAGHRDSYLAGRP